MTRKDFLKKSALILGGTALSMTAIDSLLKRNASAAKKGPFLPHEALYYKKIDETTVQCELCPRGCTLSNGQRSFCRVREPKDGKLYSMNYGLVCAAHIDPIEKKPLFHFLPGTTVYSIATAGCNFRCKSCQNWQISQFPPEEVSNQDMSPEEVVSETIRSQCPTIAYTYTDPVIFYEYMLDVSRLAKTNGIRNMFHSNGSFSRGPMEEISMYLDAANIDLKGFTQEFYSDFAAGYLNTTLENLKTLKKNNVWVEITNLVVPTLNDDMGKIKEMCMWVSDNLGPDVPLHFSRFWPDYKLTHLYPTPTETLEACRKTAMAAGIRYAYIGNIPGHPAENTYCHGCKRPIISRSGYIVMENHIKDGTCGYCGVKIPGIWS